MNDNTRFDVAAYERRIDDERRAFRRARRLDLKWAGVAYAVAIWCGTSIAVFGPGLAETVVGLWCAAVGAAFLDAGLGSLFEEGEK